MATPEPGHWQEEPCGCGLTVGLECLSWRKCPTHAAAPALLLALTDLTGGIENAVEAATLRTWAARARALLRAIEG